MRFKKGDLLTGKYRPNQEPLARVEKVTSEGVVHCVNLVACDTMKEGDTFQFTQGENTHYLLHTKK